jgi:hypothetical protein
MKLARSSMTVAALQAFGASLRKRPAYRVL